MPELNFSGTHFVDAIVAYEGAFPVSNYSKKKIINNIWKILESHPAFYLQAAPTFSLSYLIQKSVHKNPSFSEVSAADFRMILKYYKLLP